MLDKSFCFFFARFAILHLASFLGGGNLLQFNQYHLSSEKKLFVWTIYWGNQEGVKFAGARSVFGVFVGGLKFPVVPVGMNFRLTWMALASRRFVKILKPLSSSKLHLRSEISNFWKV